MKCCSSYVILLLASAAACSSSSPETMRACTRIGCTDGVTVAVTSTLPQPITVSVRSGTAVLHTFRCDPGQPCESLVRDQTPAEITVVVEGLPGQASKTFRPEYRAVRPNGEDCPPTCNQARVQLAVN